MHDFLINLFGSGSFIPHGHCYLWKPGLVWLHLISDAIIALAYYSIPLTLFYFVRKRQDLPFSWIFLLFAAFIVSCGTTHIAEIWTLWHPTYWLSGIIKSGTAIVSLFTAIELVPLVPQALALPSPKQLRQANEALQVQIEERLRVENELRGLQDELEQRVQARTAELVNVNQQLQQEIDERHRAEAALRVSRERLVLAQQVGKIGTYEWNFQTEELIWTEEMEALFGLAPGSFEGSYEHWLKRLHPDDRPAADLAARRTAAEGADFDTEFRIVLPDGTIRWAAARAKSFYDGAGKPNRSIGVNMDITDRKKVQQELQQTLQTLRTLIQASPLPIVVIEPDRTVKLWSAAAEQLFGWSEAELLGQLLPIVPEEKQEECRQLREAVTNGEVFFGLETYRRRRNGSNVVLSISAAPLYDDRSSVNGILLILQDITERQQALSALRDSEERLRLALMAANQGLYDLNVQTGETIVSPEYARMLGYEPDEFQETNAQWRDRLHPDDVAAVYQVYEDYLAQRRDRYRVEFRQRTKSGDWKWILSTGKIVSWDDRGQPLRMLGTHTDITDRQRDQEALRKREQRLDLATSAAKLGVFEWNVQADRTVWENRQMYEIFGHALEDGTLNKAQFTANVIHPEDREALELRLAEGIRPNNLFHTTCRIRRRNDGQWRWVECSGQFELALDGTPLRLIGVLGDITDRKQTEQEREQLLERQSSKRG
jgi:PAS domain S-box-containing protein